MGNSRMKSFRAVYPRHQLAPIFIFLWWQELLVSISIKTWGNGLGAVVQVSSKHFLEGFSPNYLFFFTEGSFLHLEMSTLEGWFFNLLCPWKKRGLSPNVFQKEVVLRNIPVQVHLAFSSNPNVAQSSFNLLLIHFIFIQFFLQFLIRWQKNYFV